MIILISGSQDFTAEVTRIELKIVNIRHGDNIIVTGKHNVSRYSVRTADPSSHPHPTHRSKNLKEHSFIVLVVSWESIMTTKTELFAIPFGRTKTPL